MIKPPRTNKTPTIQSLSLDNWNRGRVSILDDNRGLIDGLDESVNVWLTQNGVVEARPGLRLYGTQPLGTVLGWTEITMIDNGLPVNYILSVQKVGSTAKVYYSKDGGAWVHATGIEYSNFDTEYNFLQTNNKCLILDGVNKTHYFDFGTKRVHRFEQLSKPTDLAISKTGLEAGGVVLRYGVTSQSYGETTPAYFTTQKVNLDRQDWEAGKQSVTLTWKCNNPKVQRFLVYLGSEAGKEQYLTYIANDGSGTFKFTDNGVLPPQPGTLVPEVDTSDGVIGRRAANVNGTTYLLGDKNNPFRILYDGGTPKTALNFSPFGGGHIDMPVGKDIPNAIVDFRTGKGDPVPTVMLQGSSGFGSQKHLVDNIIDVGGVPITVLGVQDANGREGTDAPNAILKYQESLYYLSKNGAHTTGTQPEIQSILSTKKVSATIAEDFKNLNVRSLSKASGMVYDGRLLWALAVGSVENNQIWINDLERGGAWILPWLIPAKFLMHYGSNDGKTHQLALVNNKICEFDFDSNETLDMGLPFGTKIKTSKTKLNKDTDVFSRVLDVTIKLIQPEGDFTVVVRGRRPGKQYQKTVQKYFAGQQRRVGWGDKFNFPKIFGWARPKSIKVQKSTETKNIRIKINKDLKWVSVELKTTGLVKWKLHEIKVRHVPIGYKEDRDV